MSQQLILLGILIIFIGFIVVFIGALSQKAETKIAVGCFIGFIPFGFANDKRLLWILLAFMGIILFFFVILPYFWR